MVCVDLTIKNETQYPIEELVPEHAGDAGSRSGTLSCPAGGESVVNLRPESGFFGVEKGIDYRFCIKSGEGKWPVSIYVDFPAVGADRWGVEGVLEQKGAFEALRTCDLCMPMTYSGKSGPDNAHQLSLRVLTEKQGQAEGVETTRLPEEGCDAREGNVTGHHLLGVALEMGVMTLDSVTEKVLGGMDGMAAAVFEEPEQEKGSTSTTAAPKVEEAATKKDQKPKWAEEEVMKYEVIKELLGGNESKQYQDLKKIIEYEYAYSGRGTPSAATLPRLMEEHVMRCYLKPDPDRRKSGQDQPVSDIEKILKAGQAAARPAPS